MTRYEKPVGEGHEAMRVWLLGSFRVAVGDRPIEKDAWRLRKAAALVKLLALAPGHSLQREQIMSILWPDSDRRTASNNLRKTLHDARRILDPAMGTLYLATEYESLVLCPSGDLWVDVDAFEEATATARRSKDPAAYRAALDLYLGDLLPEDRYEEWTESRRQELRRLYLSLLVELARLYDDRGEHKRGIEVLQRAVTKEPTLEEAHVGIMRLYALSGQRRDALQQYERLREVLSQELGAQPDATTRQFRDNIASGKFSSVQPASPPQGELPDAGKHNLPAPRTSFVGREREMLEIKRTLTMTRLLTLTGAGGSGKTRLALEVARNLVGAYQDGVWLVELASLTEGDLVPQTVAGVLGIQEQPGQPLIESLAEALRFKEMLLVVDNCEHLVEAAAQLVDALLNSCPRLRVLATSREVLDVGGEVNWSVPALSVPTRSRPLSVRELEGYESMRLFAERARKRIPVFTLGNENMHVIAEICRRLDGVPLAIELAAARVGALSLTQISDRLEDSLGLLTGGGRTSVARQRTLRGALDWSHELLAEDEKNLFARLSVFRGGWTLETAEAVSTGWGVEKDEILDLISGLVDKSMVIAEPTGEDEVRYRLLEPVRQYALTKLEESGGARQVKYRHATFFLELAEEAEPRWRGPEETMWLGRLEKEHDNIRTALSWSLKEGDAETTLRLTGALSLFWITRGYFAEGARWLQEALAQGEKVAKGTRAGAVFGLGDILRRQGEFRQAKAYILEALALYEELRNSGRVADLLQHLGWVALSAGDLSQAMKLYEESLAGAQESGNQRLVPRALNGLALTARARGEIERARSLWAETLALNRERENIVGISSVLLNLGYTELAMGNHKRSTEMFQEALTLARKLGDRSNQAACLIGLGMTTMLQGDPHAAEAMLKDGLLMVLEIGIKLHLPGSLEGLAEAAEALDQPLRAARLWGTAATLRENIGIPWETTERMLHEPQLVAARSKLDEATWEAAFAEGRAMTLEEAVEYALSEEEHATPTPAAEQLSSDQRSASLTRREGEIAAMVAQGLTNRQIAQELTISQHTAATHVGRILKKLGLRSRAQIGSWLTERQTAADLD